MNESQLGVQVMQLLVEFGLVHCISATQLGKPNRNHKTWKGVSLKAAQTSQCALIIDDQRN